MPSVRVASLLLALVATGSIPTSGVAGEVDEAWHVVSRRTHDAGAFTQGLELTHDGRLLESTGLYGRSTLRAVDPASGAILASVDLSDDEFGEGLTIVDDRVIQLTWRNEVAIVRDLATFEELGRFSYEGPGWGLCYDGERLVMSDGSDTLSFRDPDTFEVLGEVAVRFEGQPLDQLNELECVDDHVWANVWKSDSIYRIDPDDGSADRRLDLAGILEPHPARELSTSVLNGIAYDEAAGTYLVTGKRWPELIEIRLSGDPQARRRGDPSSE